MCERRAYASVSIIKSCVITGGVTGRDEGGASLVRGTDGTIVNHRRIGRHVNLVSNTRCAPYEREREREPHYQRVFNAKRAFR